MTNEQKNQYVEQYIGELAKGINEQFNKELIDEDKITRVVTMIKDGGSSINEYEEYTSYVKQTAKQLAQKVIDDYLELQRQLEEMMRRYQQEQLDELATLNVDVDTNGIYLSQQQIDLLMITDISSKEEMKNYIENICGQFPNMKIKDVIANFNSITSQEQLEQAKQELYQKYQDGLISYLDNAQMSDVEKAKVKLERLGINGQELDYCLALVSQNKINETFNYLGQKYGNDFITKFNRTMNDDFENIKGVSYEEMKSLSELIKRDSSIDTIIIATGKFDNSVYSTLNGKTFDPYLTSKVLQFCYANGKHMRYHALFDQSHVENLLKQGKGIQDHDQILAEMKAYVKMSMEYIQKNNRQLPDGSMLINEVEIFNELVEKNKKDKDSTYEMVWEKNFGITTEEIVSCFAEIQKPNGVEFMYNETTLTESKNKRDKVEQVLYKIEQANPNLIDRFGDQMHLSDEDVMTQQGRKNLTETAQMIKRIQDGKIIVKGEEKTIKPKKTECTEHDFHFTRDFLKKSSLIDNVDLWKVKRSMQDEISKTYQQNGVKFERTTYWSLFGKNDHNIARANIKIQKENKEQGKNQPLIDTMSAGMIRDGQTFSNVKSLNGNKKKNQVVEQSQNNNERKPLKWNSPQEKTKYELKKQKNLITTMANQQQYQNSNQLSNNKAKVLTKTNSNNKSSAFANVLTLTLITGFVAGILSMIVYLMIK